MDQPSNTSFSEQKDAMDPQAFIKKHAYAMVIILLVCIIVIMLFPSKALFIVVGLVVSTLVGIGMHVFIKSSHFKQLGIELSSLRKTALISAGAGVAGLALGMSHKKLGPMFESMVGM